MRDLRQFVSVTDGLDRWFHANFYRYRETHKENQPLNKLYFVYKTNVSICDIILKAYSGSTV